MDVEQQGRVGDIRSLLNWVTYERGCDEKTADKSWLRAKMHIKALARDRDFHRIAVEEEVFRCEVCEKPTSLTKPFMFPTLCDCETRRLVGKTSVTITFRAW